MHPGCSALSRRYWSSIGVDSTGPLARNDRVREAALPTEPLAHGLRLVARREGACAHAEDGWRFRARFHGDVLDARRLEILRERLGEIAPAERSDLERESATQGERPGRLRFDRDADAAIADARGLVRSGIADHHLAKDAGSVARASD